MKSELAFIYLFSFLALVFLFMAMLPNSLTSFVAQGSVGSNVSIENFIAIDLSANLTNGFSFEEINSLPATNVNSTDNYNGAGSGSTMFANVSTDSDSGVEFCISADSGLTDSSSGEIIGIGNETYSNSSTTTSSSPALGEEKPLNTSYVKASAGTEPGNVTYFRFWLDVPSSVPSGTYNNTINFKGVETTKSC